MDALILLLSLAIIAAMLVGLVAGLNWVMRWWCR
jgi:hypothetical protein